MTDAIVYRLALLIPVHVKQKRLAIVRVDNIGDYILFRNYIPCLKENPIYGNYEIYFVGNNVWKDLSLYLDGKYFQNTLWIDKPKFRHNIIYRCYILFRLHFIAAEVAFHPTYSRDLVGDALMKGICADQKIGCFGDVVNFNEKQFHEHNNIYAKLISLGADAEVFEFYRNNEIVSQFLQQRITLDKPVLITDDKPDPNRRLPVDAKQYIIIFPGGGEAYKLWNYDNYGTVIQFLLRNYNHHIYIAGGKQDAKHADEIMRRIDNTCQRVTAIAGDISLVDMLAILSRASLYIGADTGVAHICACLGVPVIALFSGIYFGRFAPYPKSFQHSFTALYPPDMNLDTAKFHENVAAFKDGSPYSIQDITPETVIKHVEILLRRES